MDRWGIVGSRTWKRSAWVRAIVEQVPYMGRIVTGDCPTGADSQALKHARWHRPDLERLSIKADWNRYGRAAGPMRNVLVAGASDVLFAFWDGKVRGSGTLDVVRKAIALDKPTVIMWERR